MLFGACNARMVRGQCTRALSSICRLSSNFSSTFGLRHVTTSCEDSVFLTPKIRLPHVGSESTRPQTLNEKDYLHVSPAYPVTAGIPRPSYVSNLRGEPKWLPSSKYGEVKSKEAQEKMRAACALAAQALQLAIDLTSPGVTGEDVEREVHDYIVRSGAYPSPLGFHNYPKSLVVSLNEVCCHGIPNKRPFQPGDVVKYDCIVYLNGYHGDCAATVGVGDLEPRHKRLVNVCRLARDTAITLCYPGTRISEIGSCISAIADKEGFGVVDSLAGHFIGEEMHMLPLIPHIPNDNQDVLKPGQTFTIEPILTEGAASIAGWNDGWTVVTQDGGFSAQWEHTLLVTENGPEVLTLLRNEAPAVSH